MTFWDFANANPCLGTIIVLAALGAALFAFPTLSFSWGRRGGDEK